jgi:CelD/BcsL family acetyltransferase involved in cellulose biosynthesis
VLRIARGDEHWSACSPGRLLIDRTITALHPRGLRKLDLTIGDYRFKREFKPQVMPLCEVSTPLSLRGVPQVTFNRARRRARQLIDAILSPAGDLPEHDVDAVPTDAAEAICHGKAETPTG